MRKDDVTGTISKEISPLVVSRQEFPSSSKKSIRTR
jgi:hypothetical protein